MSGSATREMQQAAERRAIYVASRSFVCDPISGDSGDIIARFPQQHSCRHCKEEIINALRPRPSATVFLRSADQAIEAADDGCSFYEWLLDFLIRSRKNMGIEKEQTFYLRRQYVPGSVYDVYSITFLIGTLNYSWPCAFFDVFAEAGKLLQTLSIVPQSKHQVSENPAASYITTRPFDGDVASAASFQLAKDWLFDCYENHKNCFSSKKGYLPTRVIDLRGKDLRFVKIMPSYAYWSSEMPIYAILSYCWGGDQVYKSTKSNLRTHQARLEVAKMGRTIQDAIMVSRSLGINFLWIDSLCIIQDDPADVVAEIAKMSEYFENSYVCISAAVAAGSDEGFLAPRTDNPYRYGPFELPYRGVDGSVGALKIAIHHKYSSDQEPVNSRAWIMQESLLAPRVLWYGYRNLTWSCQTFNRSNGGPHEEWQNFEDRLSWVKIQNNTTHEVLKIGDYRHSVSAPINAWKITVQSYTARALTVSNDKLPALSGVAQKYPRIILRQIHDSVLQLKRDRWALRNLDLKKIDLVDLDEIPCPEYIAGIWKFEHPLVEEFFQPCQAFTCQQLLWTTSYCKFRRCSMSEAPFESYRAPDLPTTRRKSEYCAPSWSWASVDGPIHYEGWETRRCAPGVRLLEIRADPETPGAPFGCVKSGYMTIEGTMRDVNKPSRLDIVFRPDSEEDDSTLAHILSGKLKGKIVELVENGIAEKPKYPPWNPSTPKGLLLVADGEHYRRIGLFSLETGPTGLPYLHPGDKPESITII